VTALVLGGTGFVGRRLVETLAADGVETSVLNRGRTPNAVPDGVERLVADRTDAAAMRAALHGREWDEVYDVSGVVQATAGSGLDELVGLLDGRFGRYVFVSSQSVYRMHGRFPWDETSPTIAPDLSSYAGFKVAAEQALLAQHRAIGFPVGIARPAAIYGPYNNIYDMEHAMFRRLLDGRPILLPYGGLVVASYGHVDDLCRALRTIATHPAAVGEIFNVTAGAITSAAYVDTLAAVAGVDAHVVHVPDDVVESTGPPLCSRLFLPRHHGMLDVTKAWTVLGVTPEYDLHSGHAHTLAWLRGQGALAGEGADNDPMWGRTYDLAHETAVATSLLSPTTLHTSTTGESP